MTKSQTPFTWTFFSLFLFFPVSCSYLESTKEKNERTMKKYFADFLSRTDKVEIEYFIFTDTLHKTIKGQKQIDIFKEVINGKEDRELACDTTGRLLYFEGNTLLLEAYFSTPEGSKSDNGVVTYFLKPDIYKTLFSYRAGRSIDEFFYELKKQHNDPVKNNR